MILLGVIAIALVFVSIGVSYAVKIASQSATYSNISYTRSTGVQLDNSTIDYPIEYQVGSVARNISVSTYSTTAQYVKATITLRYVTLNATTGACTTSNLSTDNVNLVPFVGSDWYLDETVNASTGQVTARTMYLCRSLVATTSGSNIVADRSTMFTGVEFFNTGSGYSGYQLQILITLTTSTSSSFSNAPLVYTRRVAGTGSGALYNKAGSYSYGSCTTYNMRALYNKMSSTAGSYRTPIYVRNDSNAEVALSFRVNVSWVNGSGVVQNSLHINRVKLNFARNTTMVGYNATANNTSPNYKITGASTESDQLQYINGTYFYMTKLSAYQTVSLIDSVEIINYCWASVDIDNYTGMYLVVTVSDVKTVLGSASYATAASAIGSAPTSWPTNTTAAVSTYHTVEYGHTNLIDVSNVTSSTTFTTPSTFISLANNETAQVSYTFYLVAWVQYRSDASITDDEYDLVGGEYHVVSWSGPTIQVNNWYYSTNTYRFGNSTNAGTLSKDRAVQLYSTITVPSATTIISTWESSVNRTNYTDQFGYSHIVVSSSSYTPNYYLLIVPTYTVGTSGSYTATDFGSEVLIEKSSVTFNSAGTRSFALAIKNTSPYSYTGASVTISFSGTISNYSLGTGWSRSSNTYTFSGGTILPGETRVIIGSISGTASASITNIAGAGTLSTTSSPTNNITILNETQGKGIYYSANSATSVNYSGDAVSNTKKLTIINTTTSCQLVKLSVTYNYMKAGTTISTTTSVTDANWSINGTDVYYIGILAPSQVVTFGGGFTPATTSALQGSSMSLVVSASNNAVDLTAAKGTTFSAPSGWSYAAWVTAMTTKWANIFKYTYSA